MNNIKSSIYPSKIWNVVLGSKRFYPKSPLPKSSGQAPLSDKVMGSSSGPVGPGAEKDGEYKNAEYFCYNNFSYFEAELEMLKYRLPQPSAKSK